nr:PAS domain S-box protein [Sulfitobacter undariae]
MVDVADRVSHDEWHAYIAALSVEDKMPGMMGISLIEPMKNGVQVSNRPILPAGLLDAEEIYPKPIPDVAAPNDSFVVTVIEPHEVNGSVLGLDIAFEENRRKAAIKARDTGRIVISDPITLVQNGKKRAGFIALRPLYGDESSAQDVQARREDFRGWVAMAFDDELFVDLSGGQGSSFNLEVIGLQIAADDRRIFTSSPDAAVDQAKVQTTDVIEVLGRKWALTWYSTPEFEKGQRSISIWVIAIFGGIITLVIAQQSLANQRYTSEIAKEVELRTREVVSLAEQSKAIIDNALISLVMVCDNGRILSANPKFCSLFERDESDLVGHNFSDILSGAEYGDGVNAVLKQCTTPSGKKLQLKIQSSSWMGPRGNKRHVVMVDDITLEHTAVTELRENERRFNFALNAAEAGVFDVDLNTGFSVVSPSWYALLEIDPETFEGNPQVEFLKRVHPDDIADVMEADKNCILGKTSHAASEFRVSLPSGEWRWLRASAAVATRDSDGRATRFIGVQTDVTALRSTQDELDKSRLHFQHIVENAPVPLALLDREGNFLKVSQALVSSSGYSEEEFMAMDFRTVMHEHDLGDLLEATSRQLEGTQRNYRNERRFRLKNGQMIWVSVSISVAKIDELGNLFFIAQLIDVNDRREAERNKREFFANMSHELRTPLTSVKGSISLVLGTMRDQLPANAAKLLDIAQGNSERLNGLVNDFLDLEKISTGNMPFSYEHSDIREIAREAGNLIEPMANANGVEIAVSLDHEVAMAWTDANRLSQVLTNLLSNAVKFSEKGSKVDMFVEQTLHEVQVSVKDTGAGIPLSYQSRIFEPFSQSNSVETRSKGGTGLGLSIAKSLTEGMGGRISFVSGEGQGTVFTISIPNDFVPEKVASIG